VYPQYLAQIHGLRIEQIGPTLTWVMASMLFAFPLGFLLLRAIDPKFLMAAGLALFALAAFYNIQLSSLWSAEQFRVALILIGLGQPLFMIGLLLIATTGVNPPQGPSAGTFINMGRVVGQSLGVAWIGTLLSNRGAFHHEALAEAASRGTINIGNSEIGKGAYLKLIERDAQILAYNDIFLLIGASLVVTALAALVLLPRRQLYLPKKPH
jgi:DHA2 family multidrug resistance protein